MAILAVSLFFAGCPNEDPKTPVTETEDPNIDDGDNVIPEEQAETPEIDVNASQLKDAEYELDEPAVPLVVVPVSKANSASYTYEWWEAVSADSTESSATTGVTTADFTPPTGVEGDFYYYCVVEYPDAGTQAISSIVTISVVEP